MPETIAFLGATGGVALACLVRTLEDGAYNARALVRTPSKLVKLLQDRGVAQETLDSRLTVIEGDAKDVEAVKKLFAGTVDVKVVVSAIGPTPSMQLSLRAPFAVDDPTVCASSARALLAALAQFPAQSPLLAFVSTTGISTHQRWSASRDVPWALRGLYRWALHAPHEDKRAMERVAGESGRPCVVVRASLLVDGDAAGRRLRVGWEDGVGDEDVQVGWTVGRPAVGEWLFDTLIKGSAEERRRWAGRRVTVTW
ncbi:hypothetical protein JCM3770_004566 [Rhodotorula araucariae]